MIDREIITAQMRASVALATLEESDLTKAQAFALKQLVHALTLVSRRLLDVETASRSTKH